MSWIAVSPVSSNVVSTITSIVTLAIMLPSRQSPLQSPSPLTDDAHQRFGCAPELLAGANQFPPARSPSAALRLQDW